MGKYMRTLSSSRTTRLKIIGVLLALKAMSIYRNTMGYIGTVCDKSYHE